MVSFARMRPNHRNFKAPPIGVAHHLCTTDLRSRWLICLTIGILSASPLSAAQAAGFSLGGFFGKKEAAVASEASAKAASEAVSEAALSDRPSDALSEEIAADWQSHLAPLYEHLHANPELSFMEVETAKRLAIEFREAGFIVTEEVGRTGLVGVLENGDGPTVLLRADMDGLPIKEETPLAFASKAVGKNLKGNTFPIMHACAHDTHMAALVGSARYLARHKDSWSGTLIVIAQPAEEIGLGAIAMLEDGLYSRFATPDAVIAHHTLGPIPAGEVRFVPGFAMANVDSVDIHVRGIGTHGASPHTGKDPIVVASNIVTSLQTLVSREISPFETGVVTVGAFNAGTKHNIISDTAHLQLTVRSYTDEVREHLLDGIKRIARAQAVSAGLPEELMPIVEIEETYTPALYNDPALSEQAARTLTRRFGNSVRTAQPLTGGEDFSRYGRTKEDVPIFMFWVGGGIDEVLATAKDKGLAPPANHSPFFYPDAARAVTVAAEGMAAIALDVFEVGVVTSADLPDDQ